MAKAQGLDDAFPWQIPHKSIVNRIIEPYIHVNCLTTGTEKGWLNFFGLRLDKNADPTLQILAQNAFQIWNESKPQLLKPNNWHLPYIDKEDWKNVDNIVHPNDSSLNLIIRISAARCARLSYLSFDTGKRSTIEEDLKLYDRLVGGEIMHCYDNETEVLTNKGFENWNNITENSKLASIDYSTGKFMGFEIPTNIIHSEYKGKIYLYESSDINLAITPEHNLYAHRIRVYSDRQNLYPELIKANTPTTASKSNYKTVGETSMKMVSSSSGTNSENDPEILGLSGPSLGALCGFFIGDGYAGTHQISFHLRKDRKINYLENLCIENSIPLERGNDNNFKLQIPDIGRVFRNLFYTFEGKKTFPLEFLLASQEFISAFLEGLFNSDGSKKRKTWVYSTSSRELADRILILGAISGNPFTESYISSKGNIILNSSSKNYILVNDPRKSRVKIINYEGLVHCASVSGKVLIVRRKGKIILSGNSSPLEHQATPDVLRWQHPDLKDSQEWENPEQSGNLGFGWRQFRKMLPNEEVAPLPKEFSL
jgi:hypothetical protein